MVLGRIFALLYIPGPPPAGTARFDLQLHMHLCAFIPVDLLSSTSLTDSEHRPHGIALVLSLFSLVRALFQARLFCLAVALSLSCSPGCWLSRARSCSRPASRSCARPHSCSLERALAFCHPVFLSRSLALVRAQFSSPSLSPFLSRALPPSFSSLLSRLPLATLARIPSSIVLWRLMLTKQIQTMLTK